MRKLTRDSTIILGSKTYEVQELLNTLVYLRSVQVNEFFTELGLRLPRQIRIDAHKEAMLPDVIETRAERQTLADELNYRLSWYNEFSDTQLENLIVFYNDQKLNQEYFEVLWMKVLLYMGQRQVSTQSLSKLIDISIASRTKKSNFRGC